MMSWNPLPKLWNQCLRVRGLSPRVGPIEPNGENVLNFRKSYSFWVLTHTNTHTFIYKLQTNFFLFSIIGLSILRDDLSESQDGKSCCDAKLAHLRVYFWWQQCSNCTGHERCKRFNERCSFMPSSSCSNKFQKCRWSISNKNCFERNCKDFQHWIAVRFVNK